MPPGVPTDNSEAGATAAARLCEDCGLCCSGVFFDVVRLEPADRAKALAARGLKIKGRDVLQQPCAALRENLCQVYECRPARCRRFECRQFRLVAAGTIPESAARKRIDDLREQVRHLEELLAESPANNSRKPLFQRCATVLAPLTDSCMASPDLALRDRIISCRDGLKSEIAAAFLPD